MLFLEQVDKTTASSKCSHADIVTKPRKTPNLQTTFGPVGSQSFQICSIVARPSDNLQVILRLNTQRVRELPNQMVLNIDAVKLPSKVPKIIGTVCIGDKTGADFGQSPLRKPLFFDGTLEGQHCFQINYWKVSLRAVPEGHESAFPREAFMENTTIHKWVMFLIFAFLRRVQADANATCDGTICHNILEPFDVLESKGSKLHKDVSKFFKEEWGIKRNDDGEVIRKEHAVIPALEDLVRVKFSGV